jgi:hypothetical protein
MRKCVQHYEACIQRIASCKLRWMQFAQWVMYNWRRVQKFAKKEKWNCKEKDPACQSIAFIRSPFWHMLKWIP